MARCLQTLVIARDRLLDPELNSIEEYLDRNTQAYYDVLSGMTAASWQPHRDARHGSGSVSPRTTASSRP